MTDKVSSLIARLMRAGTLAGALAAGAGSVAHAQDKPPVLARAEQCLRAKVDRVVADEPQIASAATFLVSFACADEVAGATRYMRNQAYVQLFTAIGKMAAATTPPAAKGAAAGAAQGSGASSTTASPAAAAATASALFAQLKVDPETGDISMPGGSTGPLGPVNGMLSQVGGVMSQLAPDTVPVSIRKLAGDLVLEARERRKGK